MRKEMKLWLGQAERDLVSADNSLKAGDFYVSVFLSQQSVEKALKALIIQERRELIRTHSLTRMGRILSLPSSIMMKLKELEPVYQETRYPDMQPKTPSETFKEENAIKFICIANEVMECLKKMVK